MMEAARISETSVDNYFTRQYIPEDKFELHTRRRENLKSHTLYLFGRRKESHEKRLWSTTEAGTCPVRRSASHFTATNLTTRAKNCENTSSSAYSTYTNGRIKVGHVNDTATPCWKQLQCASPPPPPLSPTAKQNNNAQRQMFRTTIQGSGTTWRGRSDMRFKAPLI
jgi:hypothetical protein